MASDPHPRHDAGASAMTASAPPRVRIEVAQPRRWHIELAERLRRDLASASVTLQVRDRPPDPWDGPLLRQIVSGLQPAGPVPNPAGPADADADAAIDLTANPAPAPGTLVPLFDGEPGIAALLAALLEGRSPWIEVRRGPAGEVVARGRAGLDAAGTPDEAFRAVTARLGSLLARAIRCGPDVGSTGPAAVPAAAPRSVNTSALLRDAARRLTLTAVRGAFRLAFYPGHWCVGWRFVEERDVWDSGDLSGPAWTVLPSPAQVFYADPFPFTWGGRQYLFVEAFDHRRGKGHIAAVAFGPKGPEGPVFTVLDEPWHLSYPFILEHAGAVWMIPESGGNGTVTLYRADPFPTRWVRETDLLRGLDANDATILSHAGRFWMFATVRDGAGSPSDMLAIYTAPDLLGPWQPHPRNPVLVDGETARPAGRFVQRDGRLWRPVQDCQALYGAALGLAEVTRLDEGGFEQIVRNTIRPGPAWPGRRLHTLNRDGRLEVIDGSARSLRLRGLISGQT